MEQVTPRWWVSPPGPDESLRSCLARAADLYEADPGELWVQLNTDDPLPIGTIDDPSCAALLRVGEALGVPGASLRPHRLPDSRSQLAPHARMAICPACWLDDDAAKRPRGYRRSWTHVLRTTCPIHHAPLIIPRDRFKPDLAVALAAQQALTDCDREILNMIENFGTALEASLFRGAPWPAAWRSNPHSVRERLCEVSFSLGASRGPPLIANLSPTPTLAGFVHGPRHYWELREADGWEGFRQLVDPCERRAALWIVAWHSIPGLDQTLSPGWVDMPGLLNI